MTIAPELLRRIVEGALLAAGQPLNEDKLLSLIDEGERPEKSELRQVLQEIADSCAERGFELRQVASGWRYQVPEDLAPWVNRLWEEKPQKYSRAILETLAIIAYRQPITRGDIEEIRGVAVSSHIVKTLTERGWIKVVGQRDVPGKPSLYATTREFLDYFNLRSLDDLPTLAEIRDIESLNQSLDLGDGRPVPAPDGEAAAGDAAPAEANGEADGEDEAAATVDGDTVTDSTDAASDATHGDPEQTDDGAAGPDFTVTDEVLADPEVPVQEDPAETPVEAADTAEETHDLEAGQESGPETTATEAVAVQDGSGPEGEAEPAAGLSPDEAQHAIFEETDFDTGTPVATESGDTVAGEAVAAEDQAAALEPAGDPETEVETPASGDGLARDESIASSLPASSLFGHTGTVEAAEPEEAESQETAQPETTSS